MNRLGYIRLTFNDLKRILELPDEVKIVGVHSGAFIHEFQAIHVTVSSPQFKDVPEGNSVPRVCWEDIEPCKNSQETI